MTADRSSSQSRILNAAVHLFAREGYHGTPTRTIADLASVNEATLFRYFPTKRDLYWAALESRLERIRLDRDLRQCLQADEPPAYVIPRIVEFMVGTIVADSELTRLIRFSGIESAAIPERLFRKHLKPFLSEVSEYFRRCVARGTLCQVDPEIAAFGILGTILAHDTFINQFMGRPSPYSDLESAIAGYSTFWLTTLCLSSAQQHVRVQLYPE